MGLQPGTYSLRLAADPSPLVGVNVDVPVPQPVLTRGQVDVWRVEQVGNPDDQRYQLFILVAGQQIPLNIQSEGNDVVGNPDPPQTTWIITGVEGGPYQIQLDSPLIPPSVWTVQTPAEDGSPVVLNALLLDPIPENQKWYFVLPQ